MWKPGSTAPPVEKGAVAAKDDKKKAKPLLSHKTLAMKVPALAQQEKQDEWPDDPAAQDGEDDGTLSCFQDLPDASMEKKLGRRSFGGFNSNIEEVQKSLKSSKRFEEANEKALKDEVSAEEMADRMVKYTGLRRGQNQPNNRPPKRQKK
ncbi:hypothetical protein Ae201684P_005844 [Aphanomyces euteiches]|nr:hypothetical protein Ae201684P_005844 [Aphanomyces euteiches]